MSVLQTPRLTLRPLRESDLAPLFAIQGDQSAMRYTYCAATALDSRRTLIAHEEQRERFGFAPWVAELTQCQGTVAGWGGLCIDPYDPGWGVEVGYFLAPAFWGRGLASELALASLQHGFGPLGLHAIGAFARPKNAASIRVLQKVGLRMRRFEPDLERNYYARTRSAWLVDDAHAARGSRRARAWQRRGGPRPASSRNSG